MPTAIALSSSQPSVVQAVQPAPASLTVRHARAGARSQPPLCHDLPVPPIHGRVGRRTAARQRQRHLPVSRNACRPPGPRNGGAERRRRSDDVHLRDRAGAAA